VTCGANGEVTFDVVFSPGYIYSHRDDFGYDYSQNFDVWYFIDVGWPDEDFGVRPHLTLEVSPGEGAPPQAEWN
jgi:hypothetical protein